MVRGTRTSALVTAGSLLGVFFTLVVSSSCGGKRSFSSSGGEGGGGGVPSDEGRQNDGGAGLGPNPGGGNADAGGQGGGAKNSDAGEASGGNESQTGGESGGPMVACDSGVRRCAGNQPQVCNQAGDHWDDDGSSCANAYTCNASLGTCESTKAVRVTGGEFFRGNDSVTTTTAYPATIASFVLDKHEVTVARFRSFVNAVVGDWTPAAGAGKHTHLNGGSGLNATSGGFEAGWATSWNQHLHSTKAEWDEALACGGATWTAISGNDDKPLNCVNWYQAYAYCIWDGGFLPSEAEWNYAAAAGAQQRYFPWSVPSDSTVITAVHAVYLGAQIADVGSKSSLGDGHWLQRDLSGNLWEWTLDLHDPYSDECHDCANVTAGAARVIRGGGLYSAAAELKSSHRGSSDPTDQLPYLGFRCARSP